MKRLAIAITLGLMFATPAQAQVQVAEPWVRATVPQQKSTGAFMRLTASQPARLVSASSPVAGVVEIHEMRMEGEVMRMRAVPGIDLPAGQRVELKPGSYHVMLMELKGQVKEGASVPLVLTVEDSKGKRRALRVNAVAKPLNTSAPAQSGHDKSGHGGH